MMAQGDVRPAFRRESRSRIATRAGAFTVTFDADQSCVELAYRRARQEKDSLLDQAVDWHYNPSAAW